MPNSLFILGCAASKLEADEDDLIHDMWQISVNLYRSSAKAKTDEEQKEHRFKLQMTFLIVIISCPSQYRDWV